ncbi:unnamed protein product [Linum trigynum]|uniref:Golgin candidate 2 n=1 Tax=Linum trigynum TaxID=586398 RepID=A0AAV2D9I8_9ROSI
MSNWISSKLKVAETFFEQIDQQAADSLKKNEEQRFEDQKFAVPAKAGGAVPLKVQLKKKSPEALANDEYLGKLSADSGVRKSYSGSNAEKEVSIAPNPKPALTDSDWTELLNNPNPPSTTLNRSGRGSGIRGPRKDLKRQVSYGSSSGIVEGKRNLKASGNADRGLNTQRRSDPLLGNKLISAKRSDGEESSSSARSSNVESHTDGKVVDKLEEDHKEIVVDEVDNRKSGQGNGDGWQFQSDDISDAKVLSAGETDHHVDVSPASQNVDDVPDAKKGASDVYDRIRSTVKGKQRSGAASKSSVSNDLKRGSYSSSGGDSDSDSESGSSTDSESERERERREKILAEKAAARAAEAVKERENYVARLEGEKHYLEKILEERAKQAAEEASELQTNMMETMEAADLEKQKHNYTRMEALARLGKLETENADLAKSLATVQKNLEIESNRVTDLRQEVELKEMSVEEFKRKISETQQTGKHINQLGASKGVEFEREILEAECSFLADKIGRLEVKAKELEADIEVTRKDLEEPTEVELELKRRLGQLTDHLIQKQAQVEALSSEKATLQFRIEAVMRSLDENKSTTSSKDLESGSSTWGERASERRMALEDKLRSGRKHLGSLLEQLDAIFVAGAVFLRRNPSAKMWAGIYLVGLHFWVIYILSSHSGPAEGRSGAVVSLENINNTGAV